MTTTDYKTQVWDYLTDNEHTTDEALHLLTTVAGYNDETMDNAIYALTGYHDLEQLTEAEEA